MNRRQEQWRPIKYKDWMSINWITLIHRISERRWKFLCHCWKEFICIYTNIFKWRSKSCWCLMHYNRKAEWISNYNAIYAKMISNIKRRNIEVAISKEDFINLIKQPCIYCWDEWWNSMTNSHCRINTIKYNWIDRIDSSIWYIKDNVVSCCKKCNWAKNNMSVSDFLLHIEKIYLFNKKLKWEEYC